MDDHLILLLILLLLSGFFSGTEIAFIVANKLKIEVKARTKNIAAINAQFFIKNPNRFFSTILIGNNIVNVAIASLSSVFLAELFGFSEFDVLLVSSFFILLFGEILPKYFARELADRVVLSSALPLRFFEILFYPAIRLSAFLSEKFTRGTGMSPDNVDQLFDKEDIKILVKESEQAGIVDEHNSNLISRVFDLGDKRVHELMTPRTEIVGVEINQKIEDAILTFIESGFSKLPVYEENFDNIKGIILAKDIFKFPADINSITRSVSFIPETKKSFEVMNEFLENKVSIAIAVDEHGGTAGIITMEDILEELFGEIKDEFDVEEDICRKLSDGNYIINGNAEIDYLNLKYQLHIEEGDYETIAGFITTKLGKIPLQGEIVTIDTFTILIARASTQKIDVVRLTQNQD